MSAREERLRRKEAYEETRKKMKKIEEELEALESDDSEIEMLKKTKNKKRLFNDKQWKLLVGVMGTSTLNLNL